MFGFNDLNLNFQVERIISEESAVPGGTEISWEYVGSTVSAQRIKVNASLHNTLRPSVGGWIVFKDGRIEYLSKDVYEAMYPKASVTKL